MNAHFRELRGNFQKVWHCETFWLTTVDYYPNWINQGGKADSWEQVEEQYEILKKTGLHHIDIVRQLCKDGWTALHGGSKNNVRGFCKTQGNEFNSLLVYLALIEISVAIPKARISISDEGEFLYCDVILKNGKAFPNLSSLKESIDSWGSTAFANTQTKAMREVRKDIVSTMHKDDIGELDLSGSGKGYALKYYKEYLNKYKLVMNIMREHWTSEYPCCPHNISGSDGVDPMALSRNVDIKKFKDYKMSPATMMDGFRGEGFGLAEDAEGYSYQMISKIMNLFGDVDGAKVEVLGAEKNDN